MPAVLNLSNEVVKLRGEVKRVRVLIIRKLTRQITALKKKKGNEADLEKNQRRAARLLQEIHELRVLAPDSITKAALQKDISFEKVCQDKAASLSERATARIATRPQFSKKIQNIKDAIKAFKDERINATKTEKKRKKNSEGPVDQSKGEAAQDVVGEEGGDRDGGKQGEESGVPMQPEEEDSQHSQEKLGEDLAEQKSQDGESTSSIIEKSLDRPNDPEEVVKMRKEVKKLRVLLLRKLTHQAAVLKSKKTDEEPEMKENQECAARLLQEIQVLRVLRPDHVTKAAIEDTSHLQKMLQDPDASPLDRATAKMATHPRFINKLQAVRDAIKKEQLKAAEAEQRKKERGEDGVQSDESYPITVGNDLGKVVEEDDEEEEEEEEDGSDDDDDDSEDDDSNEVDDDDDSDDDESDEDGEENDDDDEPGKSEQDEEEKEDEDSHLSIKIQSSSTITQKEETSLEAPLLPVQVMPQEVKPQKTSATLVKQVDQSVTPKVDSTKKLPADSEKIPVNKAIKDKPVPQNRQASKPETKRVESENDEEESDLESSDDDGKEKEYFDDSTEERFRKQSSQSEDSDDNDFFIGKVSKFKKKKKDKSGEGKSDTNRPEREEEGTHLPSKDFKPKLQTIFCSTLSSSSRGPEAQRHSFGHGGPKQSRFQNQRRHPEAEASWSKNRGPGPDRKPAASTFHNQASRPGSLGQKGRGHLGDQGRGRLPFARQENPKHGDPPGKFQNPPQHTEQALHPSWEASRKRKEQQGQIAVFQGKKIKFDDDD